MVKISKFNFPPEEQAAFDSACHDHGLDPQLFNYGATGDNAALGTGLIAREVVVYYRGHAKKYPGTNWVAIFHEDLLAGEWGSG